MTNRQAAAQETRRRLVSAAKKIICEKGLTGVSVEEITQACGVSKGTFYTYFKRKEDIVLELSRDMFGEILAEAQAQPGPFPQKLTYYMVHFSDYIEKGSLKMAQGWICNVSNPSVCPDGAQKLRKDLSSLETLLQTGVDQGELSPHTPVPALAYHLTEVLYGQLLCWALEDGKTSLADRTRDYCQALLPGLLHPYLL